MSAATLKMHIDLSGIAGRVQRLLKRATYLVAVGLNSVRGITTESLQMPELSITQEYDHTNPWSVDETKEEWRRWVLTNGFRDIAEIVSGTLEEVHTVLAIWSVIDPSQSDTLVKAKDWNDRVAARQEQFHRRTFPQKLEFLKSQYGFQLGADHIAEIQSVNAARNCYVHRGGRVADLDADATGRLVLRWRRLGFFLNIDGLETELRLPYYAEKEATVTIRVDKRERAFAPGSPLEISLQDFSEICWTLFAFAQHCAEAVEAYGRGKGFQIAAGLRNEKESSDGEGAEV